MKVFKLRDLGVGVRVFLACFNYRTWRRRCLQLPWETRLADRTSPSAEAGRAGLWLETLRASRNGGSGQRRQTLSVYTVRGAFGRHCFSFSFGRWSRDRHRLAKASWLSVMVFKFARGLWAVWQVKSSFGLSVRWRMGLRLSTFLWECDFWVQRLSPFSVWKVHSLSHEAPR